MRVLIVGANGQTGRIVTGLLGAGPHTALAMIRDPAQADRLESLDARAVVADLEQDCTAAVDGCDAAIFAAGSGPKTSAQKTIDIDRNGAIRLIDTCVEQGVQRFVMLSAMRTEDPESAPEKLRHYLRAKADADEHLRSSGLNYTIVKPGRLTNEPGGDHIKAAERLGEYGEISRADVARVLVEVLEESNSYRRQVEILAGDTPIAEALGSF